jgi:hypothetical protein
VPPPEPDLRLSSLDLDESGRLLDPRSGKPAHPAEIRSLLERLVIVGKSTTDIVVFVHGWRTDAERADSAVRRFAGLVDRTFNAAPHQYPRLGQDFRPQYVSIRWPSDSSPLPAGYRKIRDRARAMTDQGDAATILSGLLGYLNERRQKPPTGPDVLRARAGQYLHCVGHSFGGRFLGHAIARAAAPPTRLGWPWQDRRYPYVVDSLVVYQMAMRPDAFETELRALLTAAPINGPIVLTHSRHDRALGLWHKLVEDNVPGIGYEGAVGPDGQATTVVLHGSSELYKRDELTHRIVNVDATWRYDGDRHTAPGSHSDFFHDESAHLFLSVANYSR